MKELCIGGVVFSSATQAKKEISGLLQSHQPGQVVAEECWEFLDALLDRHPEAEQIRGCGVVAFFVDRDSFGSQCFWVLRSDGSRQHFSYRQCVKPTTRSQWATDAFRCEIAPQILRFKRDQFAENGVVPCALTGALVTWYECHVDHVVPFAEVLKNFLSQEPGLPLEDVDVEEVGVGGVRLESRELASFWCDFHRQHAVLRITTAKANLSRSRLTP
jgi:hypothetical protein